MLLRKTATVLQVNLKLHTMLPTVLTDEPSARVTTLLVLAAIGVKSTSCLAIVSLQKFENKQPVSIRQLMFNEHEEVVTGAIVPLNEEYSSGPPRITPKCKRLPRAGCLEFALLLPLVDPQWGVPLALADPQLGCTVVTGLRGCCASRL